MKKEWSKNQEKYKSSQKWTNNDECFRFSRNEFFEYRGTLFSEEYIVPR